MSKTLKGIFFGVIGTLLSIFVLGFAAFKILGPQALPSISGDAAMDGIISKMVEAAEYVDSETEPGSIDRAQGQRFLLRIIERTIRTQPMLASGRFLESKNIGFREIEETSPTSHIKCSTLVREVLKQEIRWSLLIYRLMKTVITRSF